MNRKILITGARGFLGSTLMLVLPKFGYEPIEFEGDIRDAESVQRQLSGHAPLWVIHTAAKIDVGWCEKNQEEATSVNIEGTRSIVKATQSVGASVLFVSTTSVFSGEGGNYREEDPVNPRNHYSRTKVEGERIVREGKGTVVRLTLLGTHPSGVRGKNFFEWIAASAEENKDLQLFNDQFVNQISNWSAADFFAKILQLPQPEATLHLGSRDVLSKADIAKMILNRYPNYQGTLEAVSVDSVGDGLYRPKQMWLNTEKAASLFGAMPRTEEELQKIWNSH
ncbi:NAD(P)-dependent oxidoreductase [Candidatus Kaiserbacteria bacterium]|nr:NAD(P)-dependent oxidoreductase [Candidatus Kaiserbacteria bacterium]